MRLQRIGGDCRNGTCPTVYSTDRNTYVVQGYPVTDGEALTQLSLPCGESAVEIPASLLREIVDAV